MYHQVVRAGWTPVVCSAALPALLEAAPSNPAALQTLGAVAATAPALAARTLSVVADTLQVPVADSAVSATALGVCRQMLPCVEGGGEAGEALGAVARSLMGMVDTSDSVQVCVGITPLNC